MRIHTTLGAAHAPILEPAIATANTAAGLLNRSGCSKRWTCGQEDLDRVSPASSSTNNSNMKVLHLLSNIGLDRDRRLDT